MRKTLAKSDSKNITVDTLGLADLLTCGRSTAVKIGTEAGARIQIGRRVFWSVDKVRAYLNEQAE